jgi:hypothetical protein
LWIKDIWEGWLALAGFGWLWLWWAADKLAAPPDGILKTKPRNGGEREGDFSCSSSTSDQRAYRGDTDTDTVMRSWGCEGVIR